jgi:hypothetical protein
MGFSSSRATLFFSHDCLLRKKKYADDEFDELLSDHNFWRTLFFEDKK